MQSSRLLALSATLAVSACATPPARPVPPDLPVEWRHVVALPASTSANTQWWEPFKGSGLEPLLTLAIHDNPGLGAIAERVAAARLQRQHATDTLLPRLDARTYNAIDPDASAAYVMGGFEAVWEIGLFGRLEAVRDLSQAELDSALADAEAAQTALLGNIANDYVVLAGAIENARLSTLEIALQRQREAALLRRVDLGLSSTSELRMATLARLAAEQSLREAKEQGDAASIRLAVLCGSTRPQAGWQTAKLPNGQLTVPSQLPAELLRTRPDIHKAEAAVKHAAAEAGLADAARYPAISLGGLVLASRNVNSNRVAKEYEIATAGPSLEIPLFDWGFKQAQATAGHHLLAAATLDYRAVVLVAYQEAENALGQLQLATSREDTAAEALQVARQVTTATRRREELGLASPLDSLSAQASELTDEKIWNEARQERALAYVAVYHVLAGASPTGAESTGSSASR